MTGLPGVVRAKLAIASYGKHLGVALLVLGVLSLGVAGWTYANPPTTTVTERTHEQTFESTLHTSGTVTGESNIYRQGTRLRDQHIYISPAVPNLTLTVRTTAPTDKDVTLATRLELVFEASNGGTAFWQRSHVLEERRTTVSDGSMNTSTTIDIPALRDRIEPLTSDIGTGSTLDVFLRVTTSYETSRYSGRMRDTAAVHLGRDTYSIGQVGLQTTESTPETRRVVLPSRNEFTYLLPAGGGGLALLFAGLVGYYHRRLPRPGVLEDRVHRTRYSEWISAGELPPSMDGQRVAVDSLEDLVGVAVDTKKRVLFDGSRDVYAVVDGRVVYHYGDWDSPEDRDFVWTSEHE